MGNVEQKLLLSAEDQASAKIKGVEDNLDRLGTKGKAAGNLMAGSWTEFYSQINLAIDAAKTAFAVFDKIAKLGREGAVDVDLAESFERRFGAAASGMQRLRDSSKGILSDTELQKTANRLNELGFKSLPQIETSLRAAGYEAREFGGNIRVGLASIEQALVSGSLRSFARIIGYDAVVALEKEAEGLRKANTDLSRHEINLIVVSKALGIVEEKLKATGGSADAATDKYDRLTTAVDNAQSEIAILLDTVIEKSNLLDEPTGKLNTFTKVLQAINLINKERIGEVFETVKSGIVNLLGPMGQAVVLADALANKLLDKFLDKGPQPNAPYVPRLTDMTLINAQLEAATKTVEDYKKKQAVAAAQSKREWSGIFEEAERGIAAAQDLQRQVDQIFMGYNNQQDRQRYGLYEEIRQNTIDINASVLEYDSLKEETDKMLSDEEQAYNDFLKVARDGAIAAAAEMAQGIGFMVGQLMTGMSFSGENFLKMFLEIIGDFAIQLGGAMVGIGLALIGLDTALKSLNGWVAIAAGIALMAAGGVLKGIASSLGEKTAALGGGGSTPGYQTRPAPTESISPAGPSRGGEQTVIVMNFNGVVGDARGAAREILGLVNGYAGKGAPRIRAAAVAA
ncbi:MAG: hypothetical protein C4523_19700 [Myxococcales bacterium]|nr:MAG: hypothetical protein C4523_19700 [Myxococcales bacterium]